MAGIDNPILNSPFRAPTQHHLTEGKEVKPIPVPGRRPSSSVTVASKVKSKGKTQQLDLGLTSDTVVKENALINDLRRQIELWRKSYNGVSPVTRNLLEYWTGPDRKRKLFFAQIEALETLIYLTEVAPKYDRQWLARVQAVQEDDSVFRLASKMATGSGKTVVMAMIIAWHTLNKAIDFQDKRFNNAFLVVAPGLTIRDRLQVLKPQWEKNYYEVMDLIPPGYDKHILTARVEITNFHNFRLKTKMELSAGTEEILRPKEGVKLETERQMTERVCKAFGGSKNIIVLNDEAHHCYDVREDLKEKLDAEGKEAKKAARLWINGLRAIAKHRGIRAVYDVSATPYYLSGAHYPEGTLFGWVVSDFNLLEAIESGITKIPRFPVEDDAAHRGASTEEKYPIYRHIYPHVKDDLAKKGQPAPKNLPPDLSGALETLYNDFAKRFRSAQKTPGAQLPAFIVVCNNTVVSKWLFEWISGYTDETGQFIAGNLDLFKNENGELRTILTDSAALESGDPLPEEFKRAAKDEIAKAKELAKRQGRDIDDDAELLREMMNTVGRPGELGQNVRCVVSVSMLTEGWDANTVTHILGLRAFGTALICEQVVGRALRRMEYDDDENGMFAPEYAEVFGVPFDILPAGKSGSTTTSVDKILVSAPRDRQEFEIQFPALYGYQKRAVPGPITWEFNPAVHQLDLRKYVGVTLNQGAVKEPGKIHTMPKVRDQEIALQLARQIQELYFSDPESRFEISRFPELAAAALEWMRSGSLIAPDEERRWVLASLALQIEAAERVFNGLKFGEPGADTVHALFETDRLKNTSIDPFWTAESKAVAVDKRCPLTHAVTDSRWEDDAKFALETEKYVFRWVKNCVQLGFAIPWFKDGKRRWYYPDFVVAVDDGHGTDDPLNLIVEISGSHPEKAAKIDAVRSLWLPAIAQHPELGRWDVIESTAYGFVRNALRQRLGLDLLAESQLIPS